MVFSRLSLTLALHLLASSITAEAQTAEQFLLQKAVLKVAPVSIDHAHIVCHSEGCAEIHAKLKVIQERTTKAKADLAECAKNRAKLEADLQVAATKRGQVEAELQDCADKRQKLTADLAQCGIDRTAAEKGLAQCGAERAKLEAELRQCAENDRPSAVKKLQDCSEERAKLEKQLVEVVRKLKGGGGQTTKKSTRRRRRSKKSSLAEIDAEESVQAETTLRAEQSRLLTRIAELAKEAEDLGTQWDGINQRTDAANADMERVDKDEDDFATKVQAADEKELKLLGHLKKLQKRSDSVEANLEDGVGPSDRIRLGLKASDQQVQKAQSDLLANSLEQAQTTKHLLMLSLNFQHLRHEEIKDTRDQQERELTALKAKLALQEKDDHEDCDQTRAEVITAEGKAQEIKVALAECLSAKKFIQSKIDAATKASEKASTGLKECIARKAKLKIALDECHAKRDRAREKLQECLDRKKILKVKIEECHKARDAARGKLAECLKRKKELKQKIQDATAKVGGSSLLDTDEESSAQLVAMEEALGMLRDQNRKFKEFINLNEDHGARLLELANDISSHTREEGDLLAKLQAADDEESGAAGGLQTVQADVQSVIDNLDVATRDEKAAAAAAHASVVEAKKSAKNNASLTGSGGASGAASTPHAAQMLKSPGKA